MPKENPVTKQVQKQAEVSAEEKVAELNNEPQEGQAHDNPSQENVAESATLSGHALTLTLQKDMEKAYIPKELEGDMGVFNESNAVEGVPPGMKICWATPFRIDQNRHYSFLMSRGYRPVHVGEVATAPNTNAMYLPYFEDVEGYVEKDGCRLMIAFAARVDAERAADYARHQESLEVKEVEAMELTRQLEGGQPVRVSRESVPYDPLAQ